MCLVCPFCLFGPRRTTDWKQQQQQQEQAQPQQQAHAQPQQQQQQCCCSKNALVAVPWIVMGPKATGCTSLFALLLIMVLGMFFQKTKKSTFTSDEKLFTCRCQNRWWLRFWHLQVHSFSSLVKVWLLCLLKKKHDQQKCKQWSFKLCHLNRLMHAALRMNKGWCAFIRQGGLAQLGKNHCVVLVPLHKHQVKLHLFIPVFLLCIRLGYFSWCKEAVVDPPEPVRPPQEAAAPPDSALLSAAACRTWIETKSQNTIWISKLCLSFFLGTWVGIVSKFLAQRHQQLLQTARRVRTVMCGFLVRCF